MHESSAGGKASAAVLHKRHAHRLESWRATSMPSLTISPQEQGVSYGVLCVCLLAECWVRYYWLGTRCLAPATEIQACQRMGETLVVGDVNPADLRYLLGHMTAPALRRPAEERSVRASHLIAVMAATRLTCVAPSAGVSVTYVPYNDLFDATALGYVFVSAGLATDHLALTVLLVAASNHATPKKQQRLRYVRRKWNDWNECRPGQFTELLRPDNWGNVEMAEQNISRAGAAPPGIPPFCACTETLEDE